MRRRTTSLSLFLIVVLPACGDDAAEATAADQAVCESVRSVVGALEGDRSLDAVARLEVFRAATQESDNEILSGQGRRFFEVVERQVSDAEVTTEEAVAEGRRALVEGGSALGAVIDECNRLGEVVELPAYDVEGNRIDDPAAG